jgi:hypothetical protein
VDYTLTETKPGFINKYRQWGKGEIINEELTEANFVGLKVQRDNEKAGNEVLLDEDQYARVWMIRYPPGGESTPETRQEALHVLKKSFMSKQATNYPPNDIRTVDKTTDNAAVLDRYFLDDDIEEIVKCSIDISEQEDTFYEDYTEVAKMIYSEKEPSAFAKDTLGFPS